MKKIICPIDFSSNSLNAIEFAVKIAEKHQSRLTLLHIFTEEEFNRAAYSKKMREEYNPDDFDNITGFAEEMLKNLSEEINKYSKRKGLFHCDYLFDYGPLRDQLIHYADQYNYQLIVMGTTGVSDVTEAYAGSNTIKVIEKSDKPVMVIPQKAEYKDFNKIIYASDYQEEDKLALQQLIAFSLPFNAEVEVLHIAHSDKQSEEALFNEFKEDIESFVKYKKLKFAKKINEEPYIGIDEHTLEVNADMLVLLTRNKSLMEKLFLTSTTKNLSYFAVYPILVFKGS